MMSAGKAVTGEKPDITSKGLLLTTPYEGTRLSSLLTA